jgi:hypothetical protein
MYRKKNTISAKYFVVVFCKFKNNTIVGFEFQMTTMGISRKITERRMLSPAGQQYCLAKQSPWLCSG